MTRHVFDLHAHFFTLLPQKRSGELPKSVALAIWFWMSCPSTNARAERLHTALLNQQDLLVLSSVLRLSASFPLSGYCLRATAVAILPCCASLIQNPALEVGGWGWWVVCGYGCYVQL